MPLGSYPTLSDYFNVGITALNSNKLKFLTLSLSYHLIPNLIAMSVQKVALITASSAGLGAQIARAFAPDFRVVSPPTISFPIPLSLCAMFYTRH